MTVFRKLREIPYHTSYSHRGRYSEGIRRPGGGRKAVEKKRPR